MLCMLMRSGLSVTNCFLLPSTDRNTSGLLCLEENLSLSFNESFPIDSQP